MDKQERVTLYALVAMGQTGGSISFYDSCGWVRMWQNPYEMIGCLTPCNLPRYWKLYVIGYDMYKSDLADMPIHCDMHEFARRYGYSYHGGRDLMSLGKIGDVLDSLHGTGVRTHL